MNPLERSDAPVAIVLAAGRGIRAGTQLPKQLLRLGGRPVMAHAVEQHLRLGHHVILVVSDDVRGEAEATLEALDAGAGAELVRGGATRRESILAGVAAIPADVGPADAVILRNAASPNTPDDLITACVNGLAINDGMQAYMASDATTFIHADGRLESLVPRSATGFTCDPTVYRRELIDSIARELEVDDVGETTLDVARRLGASIGIVESPADNIKITTAEDLERVAEAMIAPG